MKTILLATGVELREIPVSPCPNYMAGSDGQIYSRTKYVGFGRKVFADWYALKGRTPKGKGYVSVSLCHENKKVTKNIHRLVCMAFHGLPSSPTLQVRHLDGDKLNNKPENLTWGTQVENWSDRVAHGRGMSGEDHPMSKFSNEERAHIAWAVRKGLCSQRQVSRVLGVSQSCVSAMVNSVSG